MKKSTEEKLLLIVILSPVILLAIGSIFDVLFWHHLASWLG